MPDSVRWMAAGRGGAVARRRLGVGLEERPQSRRMNGPPCDEEAPEPIGVSSSHIRPQSKQIKVEGLNTAGASLARAAATQDATRARSDRLK